jgi:isopropylmalate/homocitrate/citramalate synthase
MAKKHLQNVSQPNLFEDLFPYNEIPRITFDGKIYEEIDGNLVTFDPAALKHRDLWISDTTFRDGQQSLPPYTVEQISRAYDYLAHLSGPKGVIRQSEFFLYSEKDREAVRACQARGHRFPEITAWIRADEGDFELVRQMGLKETGVLTSCSDYHIFTKLRLDRAKALDRYLGLVKQGLDAGVRMRCHLEDVTRADIDGFVVPFIQAVMELSESVPEHLKTKVRLCDTLGFGVTFPGAALPRSIPKLIYKMIHEAGVPSERLEWHGHNDFHKVHINAASAWVYGCDICNTSLFGFGERTGNPPTEGAVFEYIGLKGTMNGMDTTVISEAADYFRNVMNVHIPATYPFVGTHFNVTRAGIHADGLARDERIYNIFDTKKFLGVPPRVAITDKSGADGVAHWVNEFLGLKGPARIKKTKMAAVMRWVTDQYNVHQRMTTISDEEMEEQIREHLPEAYMTHVGGGHKTAH